MSMSNETWFIRYAPIAVPCPKCGGRVWMGSDYDWPPELGGDFIQDRCECEKCKTEWTEENAPKDFSVNGGGYWNVVIPTTDEDVLRWTYD